MISMGEVAAATSPATDDLTDHIDLTRLVRMKTVSVSDLKAHLSRYLREVRRGGEVQILDRGVPVARLTGLAPGDGEADDERRERLIRAGILRPGSGDASALLRKQPLDLPVNLRDAVDADREDRL